ncbi:16S rRNA (uracil(1498)-N(3))-methyltransferase [Kutzneria albida]|uniref:Ribosomal RNA small subunit methyltransferase E n=1 Tax=Kutzneria albida DSM 43870 TaxID=1449976 RepID=W5W2G9_9PSEU|nr:16S rRNA (uracil(1498)-N(3))-methyltransferase [Kutzneria albida]AHH95062.1 ribosomal RNA small subunit methyltransferase E [Kutzneria albida DSM 43870]
MATTTPVFLVDQLPAGDTAVLDGPEGHHAAAVRRLRVGEELVLGDGRGGRLRCAIDSVERDTLRLTALERVRVPEPAPRVVLAQALVKGDRGELAVELATEAGVDAIVPWRASRCVAKWEDGPRGEKALAKWRSTVREAAKQSRRAWVPEVSAPVSTNQLAGLVRTCARALVLHESASERLGGLPTQGDLLLVVGPEGGISEQELGVLTEAGATAVRLGPSVLRASTAAAVALGAIGALTERWR